MAITAYLPLVDKEFRWSFEPGSEGNIVKIKEFYYFIRYPGEGTLPRKLSGTQTYFSAPYIISAVVAHVVRIAGKTGLMSYAFRQSDDSLFIFSFRYSSVLFYGVSVGLAYLCLVNILGIPWLSLLLTISAFLLNSIALKIDLMRVDLYLLFSSVFFIYTAFNLIDSPSVKINYVLFGLAFVLSASTKLNTPIFLNLPGLAIVLLAIRKNTNIKKMLLLFATVCICASIFFIEWLLYPGSIPAFIADVLREGKLWFVLAPNLPYAFYHIDSFYSHSVLTADIPSFLKQNFFQIIIGKSVLIMLISVYAASLFLLYRTWVRCQPKLLLLLAIFVIHSAGLIWGPKFIHYGYLIPFYFLMIMGFALAELRQLKWQRLFSSLSIVWILFPLIFQGCNYAYTLQQFKCSEKAFETVKMKPRDWIMNNVKLESKIATHGSTYDIPPIADEDFDFSPNFLKIPWGAPDEMITKIPPERMDLPNLTDIILLSDYNYYLRPLLLKELVESRYNFADDSIKFQQFIEHVEQISPGITKKIKDSSGNPLNRESFIKSLLSIQWRYDVSFGQALEEYFCNAIKEEELLEKITYLAANDLFAGNKAVLNLGYTSFIQSTGGMAVVCAWKQFYGDVHHVYKCMHFESPYEYYDVKWIKIIMLNEDCLSQSAV